MRSWFLVTLAAIVAGGVLVGCTEKEEQDPELMDPSAAPIGPAPDKIDPKNPPDTGPPRPDVPPPGARVPSSSGG